MISQPPQSSGASHETMQLPLVGYEVRMLLQAFGLSVMVILT